jgi:hypothetical protein
VLAQLGETVSGVRIGPKPAGEFLDMEAVRLRVVLPAFNSSSSIPEENSRI